jgi:hypothetical protein
LGIWLLVPVFLNRHIAAKPRLLRLRFGAVCRQAVIPEGC